MNKTKDINYKIMDILGIDKSGNIKSVDIKLTPDNHPLIIIKKIIVEENMIMEDDISEFEIKPKV